MNLSISSGCHPQLTNTVKPSLHRREWNARGARGWREGDLPSFPPRASLAFCVSRFSLSLPFQTPATQAKSNPGLRTPAECGHLISKDNLLRPWGKKALTLPLNSTRLIRTPRPLIRILSMAPSVSVLTEFDCTWKGNKLPQSRYWKRTRSYLSEEILAAWFPLMMDRHPGKLQLWLEKISYLFEKYPEYKLIQFFILLHLHLNALHFPLMLCRELKSNF